MSRGIFVTNILSRVIKDLRIQPKNFSYSSSTNTKLNLGQPTNVKNKIEEGNKKNLPNEAVFYLQKEDMYVCWHPEVPFPYEMSKPIPMEAPVTESSLKIQSLIPVREVFRKKDDRLRLRELMKLTYTTKYQWMGKYGKKKKFVLREMDPLKQKRDREYL